MLHEEFRSFRVYFNRSYTKRPYSTSLGGGKLPSQLIPFDILGLLLPNKLLCNINNKAVTFVRKKGNKFTLFSPTNPPSSFAPVAAPPASTRPSLPNLVLETYHSISAAQTPFTVSVQLPRGCHAPRDNLSYFPTASSSSIVKTSSVYFSLPFIQSHC